MARARAAFTLIELVVVLALLAITAAAAVPAFSAARRDPDAQVADFVAGLLTRARDIARESGAHSDVVVSPREARFWLASASETRTGVIELTAQQRLVGSDSDRVTCTFSASGPATPCAIGVRGASDAIVRVDPWTGAVSVEHLTR